MGDMDGTDGGNLDVVYFAEPPSPLLSCVKQLCRNRSDSPYGTEFTAPISVAF
jgi:hypothetical protein